MAGGRRPERYEPDFTGADENDILFYFYNKYIFSQEWDDKFSIFLKYLPIFI
jgi:hypothetical protein